MGVRAILTNSVRPAILALAPTMALADFAGDFDALLVEGKRDAAERLAAERIAAAPEDAAAHFALGLAEFLGAVEGLGQGLHRYGLANSYGNPSEIVLGGGLPFLRIPVPTNPAPEPVTYAGLRALLVEFTADLAVAEATLAAAPAKDFELPLRVPAIRLDMDGDGAGDAEGSIAALYLAVTGADFSEEGREWGRLAASGKVAPMGIDQSEVPWLQAYCHLLSAVADIPLAYDWHEALEMTFHDAFPATRLPSSGLVDEEKRLLAQLGPEPPQFDVGDYTGDWWERYRDWRDTPEGMARARWEEQSFAVRIAGLVDLGVFVHLMHWPVVKPERMAEAREHLLAMVALSRENWRRIEAETDDNREWLPGPKQTSLLPNLRVNDVVVYGWRRFLDELEAVLEGRTLLPHWRFAEGRGVNLRRFFDEPPTLDPILIAQGTSVLPYLEDGDTVSQDTVGGILNMLEAGPLGYFLWFN